MSLIAFQSWEDTYKVLLPKLRKPLKSEGKDITLQDIVKVSEKLGFPPFDSNKFFEVDSDGCFKFTVEHGVEGLPKHLEFKSLSQLEKCVQDYDCYFSNSVEGLPEALRGAANIYIKDILEACKGLGEFHLGTSTLFKIDLKGYGLHLGEFEIQGETGDPIHIIKFSNLGVLEEAIEDHTPKHEEQGDIEEKEEEDVLQQILKVGKVLKGRFPYSKIEFSIGDDGSGAFKGLDFHPFNTQTELNSFSNLNELRKVIETFLG